MSGWTDKRPMAPHISVWKWHLTMATSILHRATGIGLYVGALIAAFWIESVIFGGDVHANFTALLVSPLGKLVLYLITIAAFYHWLNGLKHMFGDAGKGLKPEGSELKAAIVMVFGVVGATCFWVGFGLF